MKTPVKILKCLRAGFFLLLFFYGKCWVEFGYIVFGFNGFLVKTQ